MTETPDFKCDLVIAGSGAGGLATAVTAAWLGLDVIVLEKEQQLGGTTAWSGGWMWVPRNPLAVASGHVEDIDGPRTYLRNELGNQYRAELVDRFLEEAPRMAAFFMAHTQMAFVDGNAIPDFHTSAGASKARSICAAPFDGRHLGARLKDLKPPLGEISPWGMGIAAGADLRHFLNATRTPASFLHTAKRVARHTADIAVHGRGLHLVAGNALVARLLASADALGVRIMTGTAVRSLTRDTTRISGVVATRNGREITVQARSGVVLACGGFPHDPARMAELFPHAPTGHEHHSAAPRSNTGDGLRLGEAVGAAIARDFPDAGAWAPVSRVPHRDGSFGHFPHLLERAKPGLIMVLPNGQRFTNEANAYHDVMRDLFRATVKGVPPVCWMICDARFIRRYGLGRVRPFPFPKGHWISNGYLKTGRTLRDLANACSIDPAGLDATITAYNPPARRGDDPAFQRGSTPYNKIQGEAAHTPNPCVAPIETAPYYAVEIVPGSLGTFAGLCTDENARALDANNRPIDGLYAVGNDMASMMGGNYPAGGITLGPAMTFGYIAAHHAAGIALDATAEKSPAAKA